ncbi:MAG: hypothetical protein ACYCPT_08360 [Acidimicrobiales bacterium]
MQTIEEYIRPYVPTAAELQNTDFATAINTIEARLKVAGRFVPFREDIEAIMLFKPSYQFVRQSTNPQLDQHHYRQLMHARCFSMAEYIAPYIPTDDELQNSDDGFTGTIERIEDGMRDAGRIVPYYDEIAFTLAGGAFEHVMDIIDPYRRLGAVGAHHAVSCPPSA